VDVASNGHRHRHDVRALGGRRRQQRLVRVAQVEIIDDRQALRQAMAVDLQHRHQALRVERPIIGGFLRVLAQIDLSAFVIHAFQVERDAHPIGGRRAPVVIEDGPRHVGSLTLAAGTAL
jgi:hypothetical protein